MKHKTTSLITFLIISLYSLTCHAISGDWRGELSLGINKLPLVFHFTQTGNEAQKCTLDSPAQGAKGIHSNIIYCDNDSISIEIKSIGASYNGKIKDNRITGTFSQRGYSFPLTLIPEKSIYDRRPQTPKPPYPYNSKDTTFMSEDGTVLSATLTIPDNATKNTPVVVMVTGSGPQNRDEELFDHRPFAVISDFLARNGVASLRYDDRGVAKSKGLFTSADINDFKSDAEAAVNLLRNMNIFGKVGIIGHSEGGTIALMIASEGVVDFAISLAGAMIKGKDIILAQNIRTLDKLGVPLKQKEDAVSLLTLIFDDIISGKDYAEINVHDYIVANNLDVPTVVSSSIKQNLNASSGNYFRELLRLDPSKWLPNIKVPTLGVNGDRDTQVSSASNLSELRKYVLNVETIEYNGLNHLFQHAKTGEITEYEQIEETISSDVLNDIYQFISELK